MLSSTGVASRRRLTTTALAVGAALMISACGSDSSSSTTTGATGATGASGATTTTSASGSTSDVQQQFDDALRQNLIQSQGLSSAVADCVLNKLHDSLSEADLQAVANGQVPQSVTQAAFDAGASCANAG